MTSDFPSSRIERKKEATKKKIIDTAMSLFKKQGFDSTTMEQIAEETDIAKGTLYNYFSSKEAIIGGHFQNLVKNMMPEAVKYIGGLPDTRSRILSMLRKQAELVKENQEFMEAYLSYRWQMMLKTFKDQSLRSGAHLLLVKLIEIGQEQGELRQDVPAEALATQLDYFRFIIIMGIVADPEKFPIEERIIQNTDLFLNGAKTR